MKYTVPTKATQEQLKQLRKWRETAEKEVQELTKRMGELTKHLTAAQERSDLLNRLIHLSEDTKTNEVHTFSRSQNYEGSKDLPPGTEWKLEDYLERIFLETGEPMHIRAIQEMLIERGVPLPGKGDEANVILRLRRASNRFVRTGRGMYGLVSWGLDEVLPSKKRKKTVRRKRARKG